MDKKSEIKAINTIIQNDNFANKIKNDVTNICIIIIVLLILLFTISIFSLYQLFKVKNLINQ